MNFLPPDYGPDWLAQASRLTALRNLGFSPKSILDVGAYHGHWAGLAYHIWSDASLFLIEANEDCRPQLTAKGFPFEIALLDSYEHDADYHYCTSGCGEGNGLFKENSGAPFVTKKVKTRKLSDVVRDRTFDLIKLDCQGAEISVMAGGINVIDRAHFVLLETQIQDYNERAPRIAEVIEWMSGFRLFDIVDFHYNSRGMLIQTDLLFAREDSEFFKIRPLS